MGRVNMIRLYDRFTKIDYAQAYDKMAKPSYCFDGRNLL